MDSLAIIAASCALIGAAVMWLWLQRDRERFARERADWHRRLQHESATIRGERNQLLDALGDAFLLLDTEHRIRFANTAARELFRDSAPVDSTISDAFLDHRLAAALDECLDTGKPVRKHVILPRQASPGAASDNAWLIDAAPLEDQIDGGDRTRVVIRDVTSEHQTGQVRKDFVANASHELRTPLAIINGYLENLLDDSLCEDPTLTRRFLKVMRKHATRISRIIEDMLVISRLESGEAAALKIKPFPFQGCIHDVLERLESVISAQQAKVKVSMPEPGLRIIGDRFYWTQVMFNLIENALKQNPGTGLRIKVRCSRTDDGVEIRISDNGIGIPETDLPFIFKRFYRVEKHHSQEQIKGTGLGLSIVKRAVEAHQGEITVTSTPGRETRFSILLPASTIDEPQEQAAKNTDRDQRPRNNAEVGKSGCARK